MSFPLNDKINSNDVSEHNLDNLSSLSQPREHIEGESEDDETDYDADYDPSTDCDMGMNRNVDL